MNTRGIVIAAFVTSAFAAGPVEAATVLFDFESEPIVQATPFATSSGGLTATFAGSSTAEPGAFAISFNSSSGPFPAPYAGLSGAFLATGRTSLDPASPLTINFSAPVGSISLNFALGDSSGSLSLVTGAGGLAQATGQVANGFSYAEGTLSFSGAPFQSVTLSTAANGFALDNLSVGTIAAVPEPATMMLVGAGLVGLAGLRRRARV